MADLKKLRNNTSIAQSVVVKGKQIILNPREEKLFYSEVAQVFIDRCGAAVSVVQAPASVLAPTVQSTMVYLANMTGNPAAPEKVKIKAIKDKRWFDMDVPNPVKQPRDVVLKMQGGQREYTDKDGIEAATNDFPFFVVLPPYTRRKVNKDFANWAIRRDNNCEVTSRGAVIISREPADFEPNTSWQLDDMRTYLKLLDPHADLSKHKSAAQLGQEVKSSKGRKDYDMMEYEAKENILRRLHFYLVNPVYRLPTRSEFEEYKFRKSQPEPEESVVEQSETEQPQAEAQA